MRKELLGTTALVAAGLLVGAGVGNGAFAQEFELKTTGYFQVGGGFFDEDDAAGQPAFGVRDQSVEFDGEIRFTAIQTLDNGIKVRARIEYEAINQGGGGTIVDETYLEFSGGFGLLRIGADDAAGYGMHLQAPVNPYQMGVNTPTFAVAAIGTNAISSYPSTYPGLGSDGGKILYFTPVINGLQLGVSYQPDSAANVTFPAFARVAGLTELGANAQGEIFGAGLSFSRELGDINLGISVGFNTGDNENAAQIPLVTTGTGTATITIGEVTITRLTRTTSPNTALNAGAFGTDRDQFSVGVSLGFANFTVGGSYLDDDNGFSDANDTVTWDIGVTYSVGAFTLGATYLESEREFGPGLLNRASGAKDEAKGFQIGGSYDLGPGVVLWAGAKFLDYQSPGPPVGSPAFVANGPAFSNNDMTVVAVGSSVFF